MGNQLSFVAGHLNVAKNNSDPGNTSYNRNRQIKRKKTTKCVYKIYMLLFYARKRK